MDEVGTSPAPDAPDRVGPFRILGTLGQGGMGTVYLAEQKEPVRRRVALKVIKLGMDSKQVIARFELERQALAVMNHAAIAKVFDAGLTEQGQPYFVMEFVEGTPLTDYCDNHKLSLKDRIDVFQQVCRGVQHAHQKGVVHRDLKPGNILVARKGDEHTVKIIDFGLARATDQQLIDKTIYTEKGQLIGTPEYMSPEQASGVALDIDTRTDVYSLGVLLYELLTGELPFTSDRLRAAGLLEIQRIIEEVDPEKPSTKISSAGDVASQWAQKRRISVAALRRHLKGDLDWIVLRAMAKEPERRYGSALGLALDLGRYLDHEPVEAGPPSASYKLRKVLRKYRIQVTAAAMVVVIAIAGALVAWDYAEEAWEQERIAKKAGQQAESAQRIAHERLDDFNRLSVVVRLEAAIAEAGALVPAWSSNIRPLQDWLDTHGQRLQEELGLVQQTLRRLKAKSTGLGGDDDEEPSYRFEDKADTFLFATLTDVERRLVDFAGESGLLEDVKRRHAWAMKVHSWITAHPGAEVTWKEARDAIRKADGVSASELYGAKHHKDHPIDLTPQMGLVPIGMNPKTKLWEFYHLRSAHDPRTDADPAEIVIPRHEADGSIKVTDDTGIVFVLLPGGTYTMGAQSTDPTSANYDPQAKLEESPLEETVAPFFLGRHELTQGQWMRLSLDANPSKYAPRYDVPPKPVTLSHPVEQVDWHASTRLLVEHGLVLPSEEEWEYGCRAGEETPWFPGDEVANLAGFANIQDATARERNPQWTGEFAPFIDGHVIHAPVGTYKPNAFGLYDVHGNVWEWCSSVYSSASKSRVPRGGSYDGDADSARSASRPASSPSVFGDFLGLRPARVLH